MFIPAMPVLGPADLLRSAGDPEELPFPLAAPRARFFYVARYGIYHLFRALGFGARDTVLVPSYHHGNEVKAIRKSGARVRFYPIGRDLQPDMEALEKLCRQGARALYAIHFMGWPQPILEMQRLCRQHGLLLIEDCALSLLSTAHGRPLGSFGDHAVFCLYKTVPVPHGGVLVQNGEPLEELNVLHLRPCGGLSLVARAAELGLQGLRRRFDLAGRALLALKRGTGLALSALSARRRPVGDSGFTETDADVGMSALCWRVLKRCDYETIFARRRTNFLHLQRALGDRATVLRPDLPEGVCPLFFPIVVRDKEAAVKELLARGIEAIPFFNVGDPEADELPFADTRFLRAHVVELPIHQDVTGRQIEYMAKQVARLGACAPASIPKWSTSRSSKIASASHA